MRFHRSWFVVVCSVVAAACGGGPETSDTGNPSELSESAGIPSQSAIGPVADVAPVGPLGRDYELMTSDGFVQLRPGESRSVAMTVNSVGELHGIWTLNEFQSELEEGVTVTAGPPHTLDLSTERQATFVVEVTAPVGAEPGRTGHYGVRLAPPADDAGADGTATAAFDVEVVAPGSVVGPVAVSDQLGSGADGLTFDPLENDMPADAPLDLDSLSVVVPPSNGGTLTASGLGQLTYVPGVNGEDSAIYQICDTNGSCSNARLSLWRNDG